MSSLIADLIGFASGEDKEMKCAAVTILALLSRSLHSLLQPFLQSCGSGVIESGSKYRSGFSISSESGYGSGFNPDTGF
jgi:hypothetical protein